MGETKARGAEGEAGRDAQESTQEKAPEVDKRQRAGSGRGQAKEEEGHGGGGAFRLPADGGDLLC